MKRLLQLLTMLTILGLAPSFAQAITLRANGGLGFGVGSLGLEAEWSDPELIVYPRGSVAYMFGFNGLLGGLSSWGLGLYGGAAYYLDPDRRGLFGAARVGGALLVTNSVGFFAGTATLTGGYRFVRNDFELGLEGGFTIASAQLRNADVIGITPTIAITAGFRF